MLDEAAMIHAAAITHRLRMQEWFRGEAAAYMEGTLNGFVLRVLRVREALVALEAARMAEIDAKEAMRETDQHGYVS